MLNAFNGNAATRAAAIARLHERLQAKQLTAGAMFLSGDKATPAAALIDSSDAEVWEEQLGLAKWLAYAIDYSLGRLPADRAVELATKLLDGIPPGADTSKLGSRVVSDVLASVAEELRARAEPATALLGACDAIRRLHDAACADDAPSAAAWRAARKAATAATNALPDPQDGALGACIEAAAWDPVQAPTTVGDVLRLRGQMPAQNLSQLFGWTDEDDRRTRALLGEMNEKYKKNNPDEKRDVFMLLREHHPEAEARLLAYTRFQNTENRRVGEETAVRFVSVMGALL